MSIDEKIDPMDHRLFNKNIYNMRKYGYDYSSAMKYYTKYQISNDKKEEKQLKDDYLSEINNFYMIYKKK